LTTVNGENICQSIWPHISEDLKLYQYWYKILTSHALLHNRSTYIWPVSSPGSCTHIYINTQCLSHTMYFKFKNDTIFFDTKCVCHKSYNTFSNFILGSEVSWQVQYAIKYTAEPIYCRLRLKGKWNASLTVLMMETIGSF